MTTPKKKTKKAKKHRKYKSVNAILRHTLAYFKANPKNWTRGRLRTPMPSADDGLAFCAIGGCLYFADGQKLGNSALRYLAEALGMSDAHAAKLDDVKSFIYCRNDGEGGRAKVLTALKKAAG